MSKSDTIEAILSLNPTARPEFLAEFSNEDLHDYLHRLTFRGRGTCGDDAAEPDPPLPQTAPRREALRLGTGRSAELGLPHHAAIPGPGHGQTITSFCTSRAG